MWKRCLLYSIELRGFVLWYKIVVFHIPLTSPYIFISVPEFFLSYLSHTNCLPLTRPSRFFQTKIFFLLPYLCLTIVHKRKEFNIIRGGYLIAPFSQIQNLNQEASWTFWINEGMVLIIKLWLASRENGIEFWPQQISTRPSYDPYHLRADQPTTTSHNVRTGHVP